MQRGTKSALPLRRWLGAVVVCAGVIAGPGALADDATTVIVPSASSYFLSAQAAMPAATKRQRTDRPPGLAAQTDASPLDSTADSRRCGAADRALCGLRWTTGRTRGSDVKARYYEMTDDVKTRLVGRSRAEYFDLDLDSSPEFRFQLKF